MKRPLIALVVLLAAAPALAQEAPQGVLQLRVLAEPGSGNVPQLVFGEKTTMVREGALARLWWLTVYPVPRDGPNGAKVQAVWNQMHLDCQARTIQGKAAVILDPSLNVLFKGVGGEPARAISPNSLDSRTADFVCDGKDPFPQAAATPSAAEAVRRTKAAADQAGRGAAPKASPGP